MNPLFNSSGYILDSQELRILQKDGWVSLPLSNIARVKKTSLTEAIVHLADGRKKILDLSHLSTKAFSEVSAALDSAMHDYRVLVSSKQ
jgi:hypothetical protein